MSEPSEGLNAAVAAELRGERAAKGLIVKAVAESAGMSERTAVRLLNAQRSIDMDQLERLCGALRVSPQAIMRRAEKRLRGGDDPDADARDRIRFN